MKGIRSRLLDFDYSDNTLVLTNNARSLKEIRAGIDEIMHKEVHDDFFKVVKQWHESTSCTDMLMHIYLITTVNAVYFINVFETDSYTDYHLQYCSM